MPPVSEKNCSIYLLIDPGQAFVPWAQALSRSLGILFFAPVYLGLL
jgi:hypothetical protein